MYSILKSGEYGFHAGVVRRRQCEVLSEIHLQEDRYLGNYQTRRRRSVVGVGGTGEDADAGAQWMETEITLMHLKSAIASVRKRGNTYHILGFVLNDGTPLQSVEVKIDEGP